ncbi:type II secretion system minor pseudopilin GspI [Isoalcanivorax indicus]|uniref:type II secretion system minor pseudopilin GspI n=1 Tax=Isoalcanivorax indicus TaxID=2202653 RepID=UPI000DBA56B5|nr:type II secretion system minor pseudopilin GspI [Isoalcanivorax indicus]
MARERGFTLLEVLVALGILVFAITTLMQSMGTAASNTYMLDERTQAYMLASNKLVELQVYQQWPETGSQDERIERGERHWLVRTRISGGPYPDTRRVDVEVGPDREAGRERQVLYVLTSLLGKPADEVVEVDAEGGTPP